MDFKNGCVKINLNSNSNSHKPCEASSFYVSVNKYNEAWIIQDEILA